MSSNLKPSEIRSFNTADIFRDLFKKSLAEKQLPEISADTAVIVLQKKIDLATETIQHYITHSPQRQIEIIKSLLIATKDSSKRKELVLSVSELDGALAGLNLQGEKLNEQARKLVAQFWDVIVKSTLHHTPINKQDLGLIYSSLETLHTHTEPFKEENKIAKEKIELIIQEVEKLTGNPFDREMKVESLTAPPPTPTPPTTPPPTTPTSPTA